MSIKQEVGAFFLAVFNDWIALFGGIVSILLTFAGIYVDADTYKRLIFAAAIICAVAALFRVWLLEHRRAIRAEAPPYSEEIKTHIAKLIPNLTESETAILKYLSMGISLHPNLILRHSNDIYALGNLDVKSGFLERTPNGEYRIQTTFLRAIQDYFKSHPIAPAAATT